MASCLSRRAGGGGGGGGCGGSAALGRAASFGLEAASAHARACSRRDNRLSEARRVWSGPGATSNQGSFSLSGERETLTSALPLGSERVSFSIGQSRAKLRRECFRFVSFDSKALR